MVDVARLLLERGAEVDARAKVGRAELERLECEYRAGGGGGCETRGTASCRPTTCRACSS